ncbi:hypothetical protein GQ600_27231 [Phytophthora cactorum]|nr:hypothetical protein GQ600_27231 [Phytophthora cactorum]
MDNVVQGMINIGQAWATDPSRYIIPLSGTTGVTNVRPGGSGTGSPTDVTRGLYTTFSGTCDLPPGYVWNGKHWYEPRKTARKPATTLAASHKVETKKPAGKMKQRREKYESSSDE